jgi:hypothetical protein
MTNNDPPLVVMVSSHSPGLRHATQNRHVWSYLALAVEKRPRTTTHDAPRHHAWGHGNSWPHNSTCAPSLPHILPTKSKGQHPFVSCTPDFVDAHTIRLPLQPNTLTLGNPFPSTYSGCSEHLSRPCPPAGHHTSDNCGHGCGDLQLVTPQATPPVGLLRPIVLGHRSSAGHMTHSGTSCKPLPPAPVPCTCCSCGHYDSSVLRQCLQLVQLWGHPRWLLSSLLPR